MKAMANALRFGIDSTRMKVFLLSNEDLTSNLIFVPLFNVPGIEIVGVAFTQTLGAKRRGVSGVFKLLRKMGWRYWGYLVFTNGFYKLGECLLSLRGNRARGFKSVRSEARRRGTALYASADFNSPDFLSILKEARPDLLIIRVDQILRAPLLSIPSRGTWGVHSGLLPSYQGIAAEFHSLLQGEKEIGTTIFSVTTELDKGRTLFQEALGVEPGRSVFSQMLRNNVLAGRLLEKAITLPDELEEKVPSSSHRTPSYHSWPSPEETRRFAKKGGTLISINEAFRHLWWCLTSWC